MSTFLSQVEAVLNSRPFCPLTENPDDLRALTPSHFLVGRPLTVIPEPSLAEFKVEQMLDSFWTRWSKECLQCYQTIYNWNQLTPLLQKSSLVLVIDERHPPSKWLLGWILEVHPGKDAHTRVVTVNAQSSTYKRPITKLGPLPIDVNVV